MKSRTWMIVALLLCTRVLTAAAGEEHTPAHATWSAPPAHSARHVYGAPIQPKILGRVQRNAHGRTGAHAGYSSDTHGHSRRTPSVHHARLAQDARDSR
jgi:hypothetical protein